MNSFHFTFITLLQLCSAGLLFRMSASLSSSLLTIYIYFFWPLTGSNCAGGNQKLTPDNICSRLFLLCPWSRFPSLSYLFGEGPFIVSCVARCAREPLGIAKWELLQPPLPGMAISHGRLGETAVRSWYAESCAKLMDFLNDAACQIPLLMLSVVPGFTAVGFQKGNSQMSTPDW